MQRTNISANPYNDDYDASKNFHRVLFRPRPVQARELNQVQSILMDQIERMGSHLFREGSLVIPGGVKLIQDQDYAAINFTGGSDFEDISNRGTLSIKQTSNGLIAKVAKLIPSVGNEKTTLFVDYLNSGSGQEKVFVVGGACEIIETVNGVETSIANVSIDTVGKGSWAKQLKGVWFVRGMLVQAEDQDIVISKYDTQATAKIGFRVVESIIDETIDSSLLSNATGTPNFLAPGAARLKIELVLTTIAADSTDSDFIELARVQEGGVQTKIDYTNYNIIQQALAQRSYETHGDYTVEPFGVEIKEHLHVGNNGGVYEYVDGGAEDKLVAAVKPGIGYVKGYRVQNLSMVNVNIDKARDTTFLNNAVTTADYGPYVIVQNVASLPDMDIKKKVLLLSSTSATIGYCRIRAMRRESATTYRIYIFDVNMNVDKSFGQATKLKYTDASNLFTADLVNSVMYGSNKNSLVFPLPVSVVKSLLVNGVGDTSYTVTRGFQVTTNGSGVAVIAVGSNESFAAVDGTNYFVGLSGAASVGTLFDAAATITLSGAPVGSSITIDLGVGQPNKEIRVVAPVVKLTATQKTKSLTTVTDEAVTFTAVATKNLSRSDIFSLISVKDASTNEDITSLFTYDNGVRPNWYQVGSISTANGANITRNVKVTYEYFEHSAGDYFSVDSYGALSRSVVDSYTGVSLSDSLDYRPRKDSAGDITSATSTGELVRPNDTIRSDITYYLSRRDAVYVNSEGTFGVVKGVPAIRPTAPATPNNAMRLFDLFIPAYTTNATDVFISFVDNKRYTMRDIGKLENRIKNVEYYTTLSALEAKTNAIQIFDPVTGNNRYKNGFAVDGFTDFQLADLISLGWAASIDATNGQLKPQFMENGADFVASTLTNATKKTSVFMKTYGEVVAVSQPYATRTININPFAVFTWVGSVSLTPSSDFWKDVKYLAPIIINNVNNLRGDAVQGTVWNTWTGFNTTVSTVNGLVNGRRENGRRFTTTTRTTRTDVTTATTTAFDEINETSSADNFVGNAIIPFMRSINIVIKCEKFKPFTRLYGFWDGVNINADCDMGGVKGEPLVTDASGKCIVNFLVPNSDAKKFRTGVSSVRMTDSPVNSITLGEYSSIGETTFQSGGSVDNRQVTVVNTKTLTASTTSSSTTTKSVETEVEVRIEPADPIAQTFRVPAIGGSFITKFDIFFATKAINIPVTLELRTVSTGFPTSDVFAKKVMYPSEITTSVDGSVATSFVFDDPVYVEDNVEYAVVLLADTQEYTVYISELGENVIGQNMALAKQPSLGVFLTSSNSTTWNANQLQDLKFNIHRAVFDETVDGQVVFNGSDPIALPIAFNAVSTVSGSNVLTVNMRSHGLKSGDNVVLTGLVTGNNIGDSTINGVTKVVIDATVDTFTIAASANANATGTIGGAAMFVKANYPFAVFMANIESMNFSRTSIVWEYRYLEQSPRAMSNWVEFTPKKSFDLPREGVMRIGSDFQIRATLKSTGNTLSPVIDSQSFTNILVSPRINNDVANPIYAYETKGIQFDNPSTSASFFVGAKLPNGSNMKFYFKTFDSADEDLSKKSWVELLPNNPISNDQNRFIEYTYELKNIGAFVGYKIRIVLVGTDPVSYPTLEDFRSIALA